MPNYKLTNKAVTDLSNIWNYTLMTWSESHADNYYQNLLEKFREIANNTDIGKNYIGITLDLKGLKVGRHIIFYRKTEESYVEITRILHEQMDLKNRMMEK